MKKKAISILLLGIIVHSVYACGSIAPEEVDYDEINELAQEESSESEIVQDKELSEETEETPENNEVQQTEDDESTEPVYIIEPQLTQDEAYEIIPSAKGNCSAHPHRYELYVEDVTWDEAKRRCEERGGYLATITTIEEYEYIEKGIEDSGQTQIAYWVGALTHGVSMDMTVKETR